MLLTFNLHLFVDPNVILAPENEYMSQFTWNEDYSIFVAGSKSGAVFFYSADFKLLQSTYHQQKAVQCILWHPEAFSQDSQYYGWLAVATNDENIVIYDCSSLKKDSGDPEVKRIIELCGHRGSVRCLAWNPHDGSKLVSAGEDGIAQVWDVPSKAVIASYMGDGTEGMLSVIWSPLDSGLVITGGRNNTIRVWRIAEWPPVLPSSLEASKGKKKASKSENDKQEKHEAVELSKTKKVLNTLSVLQEGGKSCLIEDCRRLFLHQQGKAEKLSCKVDATDLFKGKDDVLKLLNVESKYSCSYLESIFY